MTGLVIDRAPGRRGRRPETARRARVRPPAPPISSASDGSGTLEIRARLLLPKPSYSVGVGRDITSTLPSSPRTRLEMHAFDNTPVASEFVHALGLAGACPRRGRGIVPPRAQRRQKRALAPPRVARISYAPVADARGASSPVTLPARPFWRIVARLGRLVHLPRWTSRRRFETIAAMEVPRRAGPPVCQFLVGGTSDSSRTAGVKIQIETIRTAKKRTVVGVAGRARLSGRQPPSGCPSPDGVSRGECWSGDECAYWSCDGARRE